MIGNDLKRSSIRVATVLGLLLAAPGAQANAALPVGYDVGVVGNTVEICPRNFDSLGCPAPGGVLREDVASGEVAQLAQYCSASSPNCYVDECVPKGSYRYGFAVPYKCCNACASTDYFEPVDVTQELATNCARSSGNAGPADFTGTLPWQDEQAICTYQSQSGGAAGTAGTAGAPSGGASGSSSDGSSGGESAAGTTGTGGDNPTGGASGGDGGCSMRALRGPNGVVFAVNGTLLGLALLALRRRRRIAGV
jgi:hypothetical protein